MTIDQFIQTYNIREADAIIMQKKLFGMVDHYVIYLGVHDNQHTFVANYTKGIQVISNSELQKFLQMLVPKNIDRYPGPESERYLAVQRAISRIGEKAYNYVSNNCEHFKNWVHRGRPSSEQVDNAADALMVAGAGLAIGGAAAKSEKAALWGIGIGALGLLIKAIENNE